MVALENTCYKVTSIPGAGRGLVATRDIAKGDLILSDGAAVTGPCSRSPPCCIVCLKLTSSHPSNQCPKCLLLVCSRNCSNSDEHDVECKILSIIRVKMKRNKGGEKMYKEFLPILNSAVTAVRMVSLKWRDPESWELVSSLMDQNNQPAVLAELDAVHEAVLHNDPRILASDLRHVHGVLTTNGALLHLPPGYGRGMALYPHQSLLNHSCLCNTASQDFPQERKVEIQARFPIKAGEEITTSYIRPTQDTQSRRQFLAHTWHFWCGCPRCADPREGGALLSALVCPNTRCGGVTVLPLAPLEPDSAWACDKCGLRLAAEDQQQTLCDALEIIKSYPRDGLKAAQVEEMIAGLSRLLGLTHWLMMEIQQKLINIYNAQEKCSSSVKMRKIQLCSTVLHFMDTIDPGNESQSKLKIKMTMLEAKIDLGARSFKEGHGSKDMLAALLKQKQELLAQLATKKNGKQ